MTLCRTHKSFDLSQCSTLRDWNKFKGIPQLKPGDQQLLYLKVVGAPMPNHVCAEVARLAEEERKKKADAEAATERARKAEKEEESSPITTRTPF